jgi:hypothetical protein
VDIAVGITPDDPRYYVDVNSFTTDLGRSYRASVAAYLAFVPQQVIIVSVEDEYGNIVTFGDTDPINVASRRLALRNVRNDVAIQPQSHARMLAVNVTALKITTRIFAAPAPSLDSVFNASDLATLAAQVRTAPPSSLLAQFVQDAGAALNITSSSILVNVTSAAVFVPAPSISTSPSASPAAASTEVDAGLVVGYVGLSIFIILVFGISGYCVIAYRRHAKFETESDKVKSDFEEASSAVGDPNRPGSAIGETDIYADFAATSARRLPIDAAKRAAWAENLVSTDGTVPPEKLDALFQIIKGVHSLTGSVDAAHDLVRSIMEANRNRAAGAAATTEGDANSPSSSESDNVEDRPSSSASRLQSSQGNNNWIDAPSAGVPLTSVLDLDMQLDGSHSAGVQAPKPLTSVLRAPRTSTTGPTVDVTTHTAHNMPFSELSPVPAGNLPPMPAGFSVADDSLEAHIRAMSAVSPAGTGIPILPTYQSRGTMGANAGGVDATPESRLKQLGQLVVRARRLAAGMGPEPNVEDVTEPVMTSRMRSRGLPAGGTPSFRSSNGGTVYSRHRAAVTPVIHTETSAAPGSTYRRGMVFGHDDMYGAP